MKPYYVHIEAYFGSEAVTIAYSTLTETLHVVNFCLKHGLMADWWGW